MLYAGESPCQTPTLSATALCGEWPNVVEHGLLLGLMAGRISLTGVIARSPEMAVSMKSGENMPVSLMVCTLPYCLVLLNSCGLS